MAVYVSSFEAVAEGTQSCGMNAHNMVKIIKNNFLPKIHWYWVKRFIYVFLVFSDTL